MTGLGLIPDLDLRGAAIAGRATVYESAVRNGEYRHDVVRQFPVERAAFLVTADGGVSVWFGEDSERRSVILRLDAENISRLIGRLEQAVAQAAARARGEDRHGR